MLPACKFCFCCERGDENNTNAHQGITKMLEVSTLMTDGSWGALVRRPDSPGQRHRRAQSRHSDRGE